MIELAETREPSALEAADNYRRAAELMAGAREALIAATIRDRRDVRVRSISARAGLYPETLHKWITQRQRGPENGRAQR
jgi:hypothetical protein